jgi:hypothetical protein
MSNVLYELSMLANSGLKTEEMIYLVSNHKKIEEKYK